LLTASFQRYLEQELFRVTRKKVHVRRITPVSGGSINSAGKIETTGGVFFLKTNDAFQFPGMFEKEKKGLALLRNTKAIHIPEVILQDDFEASSFLLIKFVESKSQKPDFWELFGKRLAELHRHTDRAFGLDEDNYIGSLVQSNRQHGNWIDFFITERIEPQLKKALNSGTLNANDSKFINELFKKLDAIFPSEQPSLLHGDLWNGNYLVDEIGEPALIDPAVYYGHREMDLAMTHLFGGFEPAFYTSYDETYPLAPGFDERKDLYNLYPLLVHVNLFGSQYVNQVRAVVKKFL
jgi:protein-ribulosamine 3-kinase